MDRISQLEKLYSAVVADVLDSLGYRNQSVKAMAAAIKDFLRNLERLSVPGDSP